MIERCNALQTKVLFRNESRNVVFDQNSVAILFDLHDDIKFTVKMDHYFCKRRHEVRMFRKDRGPNRYLSYVVGFVRYISLFFETI